MNRTQAIAFTLLYDNHACFINVLSVMKRKRVCLYCNVKNLH